MAEPADRHRAFLSTLPAGPGERRLALSVVLISTAIFVAAVPFARMQLAPVPAFLPIYQSALVINDLITAVLLYGQFGIVRSRPILLLASAYLFSAFMAVAHALSFPGLFAPSGLLGSGPQTTARQYYFWHAIFPLLVIAYALLGSKSSTPRPAAAIFGSIAAVAVLACGFMLFATAGQDALPPIMQGDKDASAKIVVATATWMLSLASLPALWRRRPHSVLDLWLMVVICVWIFDTALSSVLNHARYDLGWYAGRVYGLLAASFVLVVLLLENSKLYVKLAGAHEDLQAANTELQAANKEMEAFSYSVSHDLRAPLRAMHGFTQMLQEDYGEKLDAEGRRLLEVVRANSERMGQLIEDLLAFSRLGRQPLATQQVRLEELVNETLGELRTALGARKVEFSVGKLGVAEADPALLKQALTNLLGNAAKFTRKKDPAVVEVGRREDSPAGGTAVYYVKDNGAGFDMKYYDKLFGVFQRLHSPKDFEGTGVGLAIVQRIVNRHGGRVWAESRPGEGATFYFTLQPAPRHPLAAT